MLDNLLSRDYRPVTPGEITLWLHPALVRKEKKPMRVVGIALAVLLFVSVVHAQVPQVTASPTSTGFGTLYPGEFDSETITYTCVVGPCLWRTNNNQGHKVVASDIYPGGCTYAWIYSTPGQAGDTCTMTWTFLATEAEPNCPSNTCTGSFGITVVTGDIGNVTGSASVQTQYTATVLSPKPNVSIFPNFINLGTDNANDGPAGPYYVTVMNISEVSVTITGTTSGAREFFVFGNNQCGPIGPQESCKIPVGFQGEYQCLNPYHSCDVTDAGTLKIWSQSTTPGTNETKLYFEGSVKLVGTSQYDPG
jgi:hypothetical protein